MIAWSICWIILFFIFALNVAMEIFNGTKEIRFWFCVALFLILVLIPIFTIGAYKQSVSFYDEYIAFAERAQNFTDAQEYTEVGRAINYTRKLNFYKDGFNKYGIFAPYYEKIRNLNYIPFQNYDMSEYNF